MVFNAGRAEKLGLAISLVATVKEKVWYCSKKGYRPWEHPSPQDVKSRDQGGHTIWYDEPQLLEVRFLSVASLSTFQYALAL